VTLAALHMLDTNVASAIVRGPGLALAARLRVVPITRLCVSVVTEGELLFGLARRPGATQLQIAVREFLSRVTVLAWDRAAAAKYSFLRAALESSGTPLGNLDTLIAAHALAVEASLVTNDRAFSRVVGLRFENWIEG
jgi:tRNA(fMet)-specific endonuclease VapC